MALSCTAWTLSSAHASLTDSSELETAGQPVTLSPCKWAAVGPGWCPCGPAPCLVVLIADWLPGAWSVFMRCWPAAGAKTRTNIDVSRSCWFWTSHCNATFSSIFGDCQSVYLFILTVWRLQLMRDGGRARSSSAEEQNAMLSPGFDRGRSNRAGQESVRGGS